MSSCRNVTLTTGDLLSSHAQTLVNTVNCVGVMGKGIALAFKRSYPAMYKDYVRRCDRGDVRLGRPYVYQAPDRLIVNFPTKDHWRAVSRLGDIVAGLEYLKDHYREWGIRSIAIPPLGCGNGHLDWAVVRPILIGHLNELDIPVELFVPRDLNQLAASLVNDATDENPPTPEDDEKDPAAVALGRRGGLQGGRARAEKLTAEERSEIARKAAVARWTPR
jgi:O-acetyl-ADP-ribose deacetylase (regulator of RNase III)